MKFIHIIALNMNCDEKGLLLLIARKNSNTYLKITFKPLLIGSIVVLSKLIHMLSDSNKAKPNSP